MSSLDMIRKSREWIDNIIDDDITIFITEQVADTLRGSTYSEYHCQVPITKLWSCLEVGKVQVLKLSSGSTA